MKCQKCGNEFELDEHIKIRGTNVANGEVEVGCNCPNPDCNADHCTFIGPDDLVLMD
jgi:hypothetical protein